MASRNVPFVNGQIYHIYNRGSEKRWIFKDWSTYQRGLKSAVYYQYSGPKPKFSAFLKSNNLIKTDKNVEIIAYCLMPNHYHLLVRQLKDNGITEMFSNLANSYTKYFNKRFDRVGRLFQAEFKSVVIENDEQFIHVSRYIHLNPVIANLVEYPQYWEWSSYNEYVSETGLNDICSKKLILDLFSSKLKYQEFVEDQIDYAKSLASIQHQIIDD